MNTMGIGVAAGAFTGSAAIRLRFGVPVYAIVYGGLSVLRGDHRSELLYLRGSGLTTAVLVPRAWHIGGLAGYL